MRAIAMLFAIIMLASACAELPPSSIIMRNPSTGQQVWLRQQYWYGTGLAVAAANVDAANQQREAIRAWQSMGFTEWRVP